MENIIIFGSGGHAKVIVDIIEKQGKYAISGIIDDFKPAGDTCAGYRILGNMEALKEILPQISGGVIAIGDNWKRAEFEKRILSIYPDFNFLTAVHPFTAIAKGVSIGSGTVVMAGAVINTDSKIGRHCIINTRCSVDHDNIIGDFVTIAPGAVMGGNVIVGDFSAVSLGASVIHGLKIGEHSIVGAGSNVLKNIGSFKVAYGNPAREIRDREKGERYL